MFKNSLIIMLFFCVFSLSAEDKYICTTNDVYQKYIIGAATDLSDAIFFTDKNICLSNCKTYYPCETEDTSNIYFLIDGAISLSLSDAIAFEGTMQNKNIIEIQIVANQELYDYTFSTPYSGNNFTFPDSLPKKFDDNLIYNIGYKGINGYIKLFKKTSRTIYDATCNTGDVLEDGLCYIETGATFDINITTPCVSPNKVSNTDNTICLERTTYEPTCNIGDFLKDGQCAHFDSDHVTYGLEVFKDGYLNTMNSGTYIDPNTNETLNNSFYMNIKTSGSGYTCSKLKGQIQTGDIKDNLFSSKNTCEAYCNIQEDCITVNDTNNSCIVTDESYSNPVTDWTGKTVYTESSQTLKCSSTSTQQTGCDEYKLTNNYGMVSYDLSKIGWKYSTYDGFETASTNALMTEQMQHIFSGWSGYCESGMMFSNPFNDPMTILSYAMMAYSAAGKMKEGTWAKTAHDNIQNSFDAMGEKISKSFSEGNAATATKTATTTGATTTTTAATTTSKTFSETIAKYNTAWKGSIGGINLTLKWSSIVEAAISLAFPEKEEIIQADNLLKTYMGGKASDNASLAYVSCMASIGLSFPNMASWSANDIDGMSEQLQEPYKNPIRLTDRQVAILISATSEDFVKASLMPIEANGDDMTYLALSSATYYQVGQVLCAGKLAISENLINSQTTNPPNNSNGDGANYGMAAAKLAISILPPPYNLIASLILDIVTSFESGNACSDQEIALKWGLIQFKTNQHLNFNQCHETGSECAAKYFWGSCMRRRNKYCCYDQITTKIMMEGLKEELGKSWDNCSDISINEIKDITFTPCKTGQDPYLDHCFPSNKYDEFVETMKTQASKGLDTLGMQEIMEQGINSMAIPGRDLKENCIDCN